jgi:pimeloyl-ACP methyl ester carboxylesterase
LRSEPISLEVTGRPVANQFIRQDGETSRLALIFPGLYYSCHKPLLYYTDQALAGRGFDVLQCWEDYTQPSFAELSRLEKARIMAEDGTTLLQAGRQQRAYQQILLAGKSIGTLTMAMLVAGDPDLAGATTIWLTPLLHLPPVANVARTVTGPALFVGGDQDDTYDLQVVSELQRLPNAVTLTVKGGDHSLNVPGDPLASVKALSGVVQALLSLLERQR